MTASLIDADKFEVYTWVNKSSDYVDGDQSILEAIDIAPTVDAVEIVRCRDCKHYMPQKKSAHWENRANYCNRIVTIKTQPYDFCSYGERKNEVNE